MNRGDLLKGKRNSGDTCRKEKGRQTTKQNVRNGGGTGDGVMRETHGSIPKPYSGVRHPNARRTTG